VGNSIQATSGLVGALIGNSAQSKEREKELLVMRERQAMELQMQREKQQHELKMMELAQRSAQAQATNVVIAPAVQEQTVLRTAVMPSSVDTSQLQQEIAAKCGLLIDKACGSGSVVIRAESGLALCAYPTVAYPPGQYSYVSGRLIRQQ